MAKTAKPRKKRTPQGAKKQYKVINWPEYNQALVDRGNFTLWISEKVIAQWKHENKDLKVGRPFVYSDRAVETILTFRELFHLTYRATEGFTKGIVQLMRIPVTVPDFTSLAKRAKTISISLDTPQHKGPVFLVVDSTGLKVYGEGEWKVRKHGWSKRRTWRKLHLAVNEKTQEIEAEVLTDNATDDAAVVEELLNQTPNQVSKFGGDGAYDKWKVYGTLSRRNIVPVIPPQRNAKIKQHGKSKLTPLARDEAIRGCRKLGRAEWKRQVGYHRRSLSETAMYRMKRCFGPTLKNRSDPAQKTEARLRAKILNHFTKLGLPKFVLQ
jgi:hypothetical protein